MERCQKDLLKDDVAVDELWEEGQPPNAVVLALMKILFWPPSHTWSADYEQPFMAVLCAVPCHTVIKNMPNTIFKSDQASEGYDTESSPSTAQSHHLLLLIFGSGKQV